MKYEVEISEDDLKCMAHYVVDPKTWIDEAIANKIAACRKRMLRKFIDEAIAEGRSLPSDLNGIMTTIFSDKNYKCRKDRDEEAKEPKEKKEKTDGESSQAPV